MRQYVCHCQKFSCNYFPLCHVNGTGLLDYLCPAPNTCPWLITHFLYLFDRQVDDINPVYFAIRNGSITDVNDCLTQHNQDVNQTIPGMLVTPMTEAASSYVSNILKHLIEAHGGDVNGRDMNGCTPLVVAARFDIILYITGPFIFKASPVTQPWWIYKYSTFPGGPVTFPQPHKVSHLGWLGRHIRCSAMDMKMPG